MCGLYSMLGPAEAVIQYFGLNEVPDFKPRFKVSPGTDGLVIRAGDAGNVGQLMRWGFRPTWAKKGFAPINARGETIFTNGAFKYSALRKRCIVVANGFYEPEGPKRPGRPQHYFYKENELLALAAIWTASETDNGRAYDSFAIATCEPASIVGAVHSRSPVILEGEQVATWLDSQVDEESILLPLLSPAEKNLVTHRVTDQLYKLRPDDAACIEKSA